MEDKQLTNKEKIIEWLKNPNTKPNAWKELPIRQISEEIGITYTGVHRNLADAVALHTGITPKQAMEERKKHAFDKGGTSRRLTNEQKERMEYLRFQKKMNLTEIAMELEIGYGTVQQYFKKLQQEQEN